MNPAMLGVMLDALVVRMGSGARFRICSGAQPAQGGALTAVLVNAVLADPAGTVAGGLLTLSQANGDGDMATGTGVASWGRLEATDGTWVRDFSVSGPSGPGEVRVTVLDPPAGDPEAKIYAGGRVKLGVVTLGQ